MQEGLFVILSILENGINETFNKSSTYAEKYMEEKANLFKLDPDMIEENFKEVKNYSINLIILSLGSMKFANFRFLENYMVFQAETINFKYQLL